MYKDRITLIGMALILTTASAGAEQPEVVGGESSLAGMGWRFEITVSHPDSGWDHYADGWEVLDAAGNRLGYRELFHPHVEEQPFTRALRSVMIPDGTDAVFIRTRCSRDGWSQTLHRVELTR